MTGKRRVADDPRLPRLLDAAEAAWRGRQRKLARAMAAEREAAEAVADLDARKAECLAQMSGAGSASPAQFMAACRWMQWAEAERGERNAALARARAAAMAERDAARPVFGRVAVLSKLSGKKPGG
ncbi:hypothetical protein [Tropicimonas sp. IMCC34011]|uniref:hypothetical protein n=1 Tax=Tropicimonas sp. IMCC34011 TaxID=2248759 RepID=UPI00130055B0|nr:hypothetical protein [Tropicimonas sp. IMCC34011]